MNRKVIYSLGIFCILVSLWFGYTTYVSMEREINSLKLSIDNQQEEIYNVNSKLSKLKTDIDSLQKELDERSKPKWTPLTAELSFYTASSDECGSSNGVTASGKQVQEKRTIAMSSEYPFGTKVMIDGIEYEVQDRGGIIDSNKIDIYVPTKSEALRRGRYTTTVYVLGE